MCACTHTHTHTHTHTPETTQSNLAQKEYYREGSGRLHTHAHTHTNTYTQKPPKVSFHKKSTTERILEVVGRKEQS